MKCEALLLSLCRAKNNGLKPNSALRPDQPRSAMFLAPLAAALLLVATTAVARAAAEGSFERTLKVTDPVEVEHRLRQPVDRGVARSGESRHGLRQLEN